LGKGTYLTKMHASEGQVAISMNNWMNWVPEKMKCVIVIRIPSSDNKLIRNADQKDKRDIHLYVDDLELSKYPWGHGTFEE
jgi:hypothetical protein